MSKRPEDILHIAKHFLMAFNKKFGKSFIGINAKAGRILQHIKWRGNVRELRNIIERATLIAKGPELTAEDLGPHKLNPAIEAQQPPDKLNPAIPPEGIDLPAILEAIEKQYIEEALRVTEANETKATKLLHFKYSTLRYCRRMLNIS